MSKKKQKAAEAKVKAAKAALAEAEAALVSAKTEALTYTSLELLDKAARSIWYVAEAAGHPDWIHDLERQVDAIQGKLAIELLGAGARSEGLKLLDADRWGDGEFSTNDPRHYIDDESLNGCIATWIFDNLGVRGYERAKGSDWSDWSKEEMDKHDGLLAEYHGNIVEAFTGPVGAERAKAIADSAIAAWRAGHHDT